VLNEEVVQIDGGVVRSRSGKTWNAEHVVVAVDGGAARKLGAHQDEVEWNAAHCLYFSAEEVPNKDPLLMLNGAGDGVINHLAVMSAVSPAYAPVGRELVMVGLRPGLELRGSEATEAAQRQLREWFGGVSESWELIKYSMIDRALPRRNTLPEPRYGPVAPGVWMCGDHVTTGSIQGAMESGRRTADSLLQWL
jgi:hypothetical protein